MLERGGFEPPVSREIFAKENLRKCWRNFGFKICQHLPENKFDFSSVRCPSLTSNSGVARMPGKKIPSIEPKSSVAAGRRTDSPNLPGLNRINYGRAVGRAQHRRSASGKRSTHCGSVVNHPQRRIWRCLVHSSGSGAVCFSASAVSVAGCDPSQMLWTMSGASSASGIRRLT